MEALRTTARNSHQQPLSRFEDGPDHKAGSHSAPIFGVRKRAGSPTEQDALHTEVLDCKRHRQEYQRASSWPPSKGTVFEVPEEGEGIAVNVGLGGHTASINSKCLQSGHRHRIVSSSTLRKWKRGSETDSCSRETVGTSIASCGDDQFSFQKGPCNRSTVTAISTEEGLMRSSGQSLMVARQTNPFNTRPDAQPRVTGSKRRRKGEWQFPGSKREIRKFSRDEHGDGEVVSQFVDPVDTTNFAREKELKSGTRPSGSVATLNTSRERELDRIFGSRSSSVATQITSGTRITSREEALDKVFGSRPWESSCGNVSREPTSLVESGCSGGDAGELAKVRDTSEYTCSQSEYSGKCGELGLSSSSPEFHSMSGVTEQCISSSCSGSILSGLRGSSYKRYRPKARSFIRWGFENVISRVPTPRETLADDDRCTADELISRRSEATSHSLHSVSRIAVDIETSEHRTHSNQSASSSKPASSSKTPSFDIDPQSSGDGSGDLKQKPTPTFVLSSGRLSKEQEKNIGVRPTTIDDDFDQYFAQQLML